MTTFPAHRVAILLLVAPACAPDAPAPGTPGEGPHSATTRSGATVEESGRFVAYYGPAAAEFAEFRSGLIAHRFLDTVAARLQEWLVLPEDLTLATGHCDEPNASYEPERRRVTLCYELFSALADQFAGEPGGEQLITGTLVFALSHELAHGLMDLLDLPTTGREEDAADQLAVVLLLEQGRAGDSLAFGALAWFAENAKALRPDELTFADDHGLDLQRFYNIVCWIYGRSPGRYPEIVEQGWLPSRRAGRCPAEYARIASSWSRLLGPHRRIGSR